MTITYGFYNSSGGDRVYDALQISRFFDGILVDGIYESIGNCFRVTALGGSMNVRVGTGRAWFNHTWTYNDAYITLTCQNADPLLNRIDVVYLETNSDNAVRANSVGILTGTPASSPVPPALTQNGIKMQYALAHVMVRGGVTQIIQGDITDYVGSEDTPYASSGLYSPIAPGSVGPTELATGAVVSGKIADGAISSPSSFYNNVVTTPALNAYAVTSTKLASSAVTAGKIAVGGVSATNQLVDGIVTASKIANRTRKILLPYSTPDRSVLDSHGTGYLMDDGVETCVQGSGFVPTDYVAGGTFQLNFIVHSPASSGNIYRRVYIQFSEGIGHSASDVIVNVPYAAVAVTGPTILQSVYQYSNIVDFAPEWMFNWAFLRNGAHASDTLNDHAFFVGVLLTYLADS